MEAPLNANFAPRRRSRPALRNRQTRSQGRGPGLQVADGDRRALAKPATAKIPPIKRNRKQILLPASANLLPAATCVRGSAHGCKLASRRRSRPALRDRQTRSQVAGPACKSLMATVFDDQGPAKRPGDKFRRRQISCLRAFPTPCPSAGFSTSRGRTDGLFSSLWRATGRAFGADGGVRCRRPRRGSADGGRSASHRCTRTALRKQSEWPCAVRSAFLRRPASGGAHGRVCRTLLRSRERSRRQSRRSPLAPT